MSVIMGRDELDILCDGDGAIRYAVLLFSTSPAVLWKWWTSVRVTGERRRNMAITCVALQKSDL